VLRPVFLSTFNYLELPKRCVFTGDSAISSASNYRDLLPRVLGIVPGIIPGIALRTVANDQ
jgi:hypothetical protein